MKEVKDFYHEIEQFPMLCQSCGMCAGVCPVKAVKMQQNFYGQFVPQFDENICINCNQCVKACQARKNTYMGKSIVGSYINIYIAKSCNEEHVINGSSGGVVTALLKYGLETGIFNEILSVKNTDSPVVAKPVYTKDAQSLSGSKYVSAPLCEIYDKRKEKLAVTALPCQAKAIRKQSEETFIMGLFCSKLSLEDMVKYVVEKNKKDYSKICMTHYRKGNWPGQFRAEFKDGETPVVNSLNRSLFTAAYNSYRYSSEGCLLCDDYFAESADISFGDPWGYRKQYTEGYLGETVVITRTQRGQKLLDDAVKNGIVTIEKMPLEELVKGHLKEIYNKKTAISQRIDIISKKTNLLSYDKSVLTEGDNFKILNKFAIYNNWKLRKNQKKYENNFKKSNKILFLTRYLHAYLLNARLKRSNNIQKYLNIAESEQKDV